MGSGQVFVMSGSHVRVLTPINQCLQLQYKPYMNTNDVSGKSQNCFDAHVKPTFVLYHPLFNLTFEHCLDFAGFRHIYIWLEIWVNFILKCKVPSLLCLAHFGTRSCGEVLIFWVIPIYWIPQPFHSFFKWISLFKCLFEG